MASDCTLLHTLIRARRLAIRAAGMGLHARKGDGRDWPAVVAWAERTLGEFNREIRRHGQGTV